MSKHTPAPWTFLVDKNGEGWLVNEHTGEKIIPLPAHVENKENLQLIAAVPELLEALEEMVDKFGRREGNLFSQRATVERARQAITKAKGNQSDD